MNAPPPVDLNLCDKCGERVTDPLNDATRLASEAGILGFFTYILTQRRHLFRSETCEGSPSLAQYLEGQPRDTRTFNESDELLYGYNENYEERIRAAYLSIQFEMCVD